MARQPFSLTARMRSFKHAFRGIWLILRTQHNMRIHLVAAAAVAAMGIYTRVTLHEWLFLAIAIGLVVVTELVNTGIEYLGDAITGEQDENIRKAKDVSAGAVLIAALTAVVIAGLVFIPKLISMFAS